jgi:hypothetical protein
MQGAEEETVIIKKIKEALSVMSWKELREIGINGQQAMKIKSGEDYRLYDKTIERLQFVLNIWE